ncbi:hypothetical protein IQ260_26190 [Leptolyngbya cf. ectocarpi LEGE 11479]|uniref:Uncharacterized protein n=1 Tax=Leptolyngbya cf. ectocarpi LEGE 11479 TaxID=1828722 RepID=A0A928ZZ72_LEPEC|nr:hypothetical protein [Leptolyngbya ectocarpi]MBE9070136.1 hypothetical protein [Leptolyngbya cf. ectocarpi LEGE 11479]
MNNPRQTNQPMDDPTRAEQLAKVNALLTAPCDEEWIAETERIEGDGWIEAGVMAKPYVEYLKSLTPEQHQFLRWRMRLFSILYPELKEWLQSWELGCSFDVVYRQARQLICKRLQHPTPEQTDWINVLIAEDDQNLPIEDRHLRSQVVPMLASLLTQEDQQTLADVAAKGMAQGVLQMVQREPLLSA